MKIVTPLDVFLFCGTIYVILWGALDNEIPRIGAVLGTAALSLVAGVCIGLMIGRYLIRKL